MTAEPTTVSIQLPLITPPHTVALSPAPVARHYTVFYDEHCELCRRCRLWLEGQATHVRLTFMASGSPAAARIQQTLRRQCPDWSTPRDADASANRETAAEPDGGPSPVALRLAHDDGDQPEPAGHPELMVISDNGQVWIGAPAFIMCLWATVRWRSLSYGLSSTHFGPLATWFFRTVSANRSHVSGMLEPHPCTDGACQRKD